MKRIVGSLALVWIILAGGISVAFAQGDALPQRETNLLDHPGRALFASNCAPCHGTGPGDDGSPMLPGTAALAAKYGDSRPAALELRNDLPAPVLILFVRRGVGAMPGFRSAELSDTEVTLIADYLLANSRQ